jgi:hypothetical protein
MRAPYLATLNRGIPMQNFGQYIIAAPNCTNARAASYYVKRNGKTYVAQSKRALAQLLGEFPANTAPIRPTIPVGLMRNIDNFRALSRRISRELNCNSEIARAIARRQLRNS